MGGDKQEVKELRALFGFTPGRVLQAAVLLGWIWHLCVFVCHVQLSLSLLFTEDFWLPMDLKL